MGDSKYNCVRFAVGIATGMRVSSQLQLAIHTCQICVSECQRWSENAGRICNCPCKMKKIKWFMASNYISVRHVHHMACMRKLHSIQFGSRIRNSFAQRASQNTCQNAQRQTCFHPHKSQVQRRISTDYITCLHLSQVFTFSDWFIYFDCIELVDACSNKISSHLNRKMAGDDEAADMEASGRVQHVIFFLASFWIIHHLFLRYFHIFPAGWWSGGTCSEKQARSTGCFFFQLIFS